MSNAQELINVLEERKHLITKLETSGLSAEQIYEYLRTPYTDSIDAYLEVESKWYQTVSNALRYVELEDLTDAVCFVLTELKPQEQDNG